MVKGFHMKLKILFLFALAAGMAGCATYHPLKLEDRIDLAASVPHLTVDTHTLPFRFLRTYRFDPSDGLDMTEVAMLAVANNPNLRLARDDSMIGHAQAFAAGLLPDPQFSFSRSFPPPATAGTNSTFSAELAYSLDSLVTHAAGSSASRFESQKTDLNLLWQEWQVVAQARLLFTRAITEESLLHWLVDNQNLLARRYANAKSALKDGNLTSDGVNSALSAWQDASRQVNDMERQQLQTRHDLNALLGLAPEIRLKLVAGKVPGAPDEKEVGQALADLPRRRPDLLALKAGYAAEDARYRQAILAQFPPFNVGITSSQDPSGFIAHGFSLSLVLPLLNGNRGNIKIQEATRRRLHDEYQIRLNTAYAEVKNLLAESRLIADQLHTAEAGLHIFDETTANAGKALAAGELDGSSYAAFQSSRIAKHVEVTNLKQALLENRIALLTLLGGNFDAGAVAVTEKRQ
jgi:outer membrane protein TolC